MSARVASLAVPLAGILLSVPALAQEPPRPAGPCTVVVVVPEGGCATTVIQVQPQGPAPAPYYAPPAPYYAPPAPYYAPPAPYYAPPAAYAYALPNQVSRPPSASVFSAKLWAGPSYERFYDLALYGADFGVSLGAQRGISGWYGEVEGNVGQTDHGLATYQGWVGGSWEGRIERVRLGVGVHIGFLGIERATTGALMTGVGFGGFAFATVDLYQSEEGRALYLGAKITGNVMDDGQGGGPALWGPSATLGWRY